MVEQSIVNVGFQVRVLVGSGIGEIPKKGDRHFGSLVHLSGASFDR
jgi:hypothetical protein